MNRDPSAAAPGWFVACVRRNLAGLVALHLDGHPSADTIDQVAQAWIAVLWPERGWCAHRDPARIAEAFRRLAAVSHRWPSPAAFLVHLPAAPQPAALPRPRAPVDRQALERLRAVRRRLALRLTDPARPSGPTDPTDLTGSEP